MNISDPSWYKQFKKGDIWIKKTKNKSYHDTITIISVLNKKNKKYVKIEFPTGDRIKVEPNWLFHNYEKKFTKRRA